MEMAINEAIETIAEMDKAYRTFTDKEYQSLNTVVDIARKYQKIREIVADWKSDGGAFEMSESYWLKLISEVVEDGNDD